MTLDDWKSSSICVFFFLIFAFFLYSPSWGSEDSKGTKAGETDKGAIVTAPSGTIDGEIRSVRANVQKDPTNVQSRVRLAYLLVRKGSFDEAIRHFDEALKLNPRLHDAKTGKGIALARKGKLKEAEQVLKEALYLNPNPVRAHYELGLVYEELGEQEKAVNELKEGIKKHEQGR